MQTFPIAVKELFPVVIAAAIYGNQRSGKLVLFRVDNMAVVEVLKATYSREPHDGPHLMLYFCLRSLRPHAAPSRIPLPLIKLLKCNLT